MNVCEACGGVVGAGRSGRRFAHPARRVTVAEIQALVGRYYGVSRRDIVSDRRGPPGLARARQVAMFLAATFTRSSYVAIGRAFGHRDHTTIIHGCGRIAELRESDAALDADVDALWRQLEEGAFA